VKQFDRRPAKVDLPALSHDVGLLEQLERDARRRDRDRRERLLHLALWIIAAVAAGVFAAWGIIKC
jgi:hypothetical protein